MIDLKTLSNGQLMRLFNKVKGERDVADKAYNDAVAYEKKFKMDTKSCKAYRLDEWDSEDEEEFSKQPKGKQDEFSRMLRKDPYGIKAALEKVIRLNEGLGKIQKQIMARQDARKTAVAMMAHPMLSENSPCSGVNSDILRCIMKYM